VENQNKSVTLRHLRTLGIALSLFTLSFALCLQIHAQSTETVLHAFTGPPNDGARPQGGVVFDQSGNLFGATSEGGNSRCTRTGCGTLYELSPDGSGSWAYATIYTYLGGADGADPGTTPAVDGKGNVYVSALDGGSKAYGTILKFESNGEGGWTPELVHSFQGPDGAYPFGLTLDQAGNLFGMTEDGGGAAGDGTVFELSPKSGGGWTEQVLHTFTGTGSDGAYPRFNTVTLDAAGNIFGLTVGGGNPACPGGCGVLFVLSKNSSGQWLYKTLYEFSGGSDGTASSGNVVVDSSDNIYGASPTGGRLAGTCQLDGCGYIYKFTHGTGANWTKTTLYQFAPLTVNGDGTAPENIAMDSAGNIYGITDTTLFELTPASGGKWIKTTLAAFNYGPNGSEPTGSLLLDSSGNIYGVDEQGGDLSCTINYSTGCGLVYEVTP
jgi:uncharacterized repeat protein (TIGR03803 family)